MAPASAAVVSETLPAMGMVPTPVPPRPLRIKSFDWSARDAEFVESRPDLAAEVLGKVRDPRSVSLKPGTGRPRPARRRSFRIQTESARKAP